MSFILLNFIIFSIMSNISFNVSLESGKKLIAMSKDKGLLRVYKKEDKKLKIEKEFFISYGLNEGSKDKEGDKKTPLGIYFAKEKKYYTDLKSSIYGAMAIVLNYPNKIDKLNKKTGSGIWIHGIDSVERLESKNSSKGCVILENESLLKLSNYVLIKKTPILILKNFNNLNNIKFNGKNFIKFKSKNLNYIVNLSDTYTYRKINMDKKKL
jgi:murein L,D-transpeptidase YafK